MNWQIGALVTLEPVSAPGMLHEARLIGCAPGQSLLITPPTLNGCPVKIKESQTWGIRVLVNGNAFRFVSSVQCAHKKPFEYVCLTYPNILMQAKPRRHARHAVLLQAILRHNMGHGRREGHIVNLSEGGACFATSMPAASWGSQAVLDLDLSDGTQLSLQVALRTVQPQVDNGFRAGLAFEDVDQSARAALNRFLASLNTNPSEARPTEAA
ncbi:PilZ domain-containing protein [Noviherbaspirillum humi]|uniref:PilZ domain-containing protein n=1 Tax=Noviherbaspirillum humi TaxID=1688639 RepID=UPI001595D9A4|nr:flagellar brake protein [Noviherbaspirillum humi]